MSAFPGLAAVLTHLSRVARTRRTAHAAWVGAGTLGFAAAGGALGAAAAGYPLPGLGIVLAVVLGTAAAGVLGARRPGPAADTLAGIVDREVALADAALTLVAPMGRSPAGFAAALGAATDARLAAAPPPRLPRRPVPRWPAGGIASLLLLLLLLDPRPPRGEWPDEAAPPRPPEGMTPPPNAVEPPHRPKPPPAGPGPGSAEPRPDPSGPLPGPSTPDPDPTAPPKPSRPDQGPQAPPEGPKRGGTGPQGGSGGADAPLFGTPDRLAVRIARVPVQPLFDATPGERRLVDAPESAAPPAAAGGRPAAAAPGRDSADPRHADEAALLEAIRDPAEREAVRRYFARRAGSGR